MRALQVRSVLVTREGRMLNASDWCSINHRVIMFRLTDIWPKYDTYRRSFCSLMSNSRSRIWKQVFICVAQAQVYFLYAYATELLSHNGPRAAAWWRQWRLRILDFHQARKWSVLYCHSSHWGLSSPSPIARPSHLFGKGCNNHSATFPWMGNLFEMRRQHHLYFRLFILTSIASKLQKSFQMVGIYPRSLQCSAFKYCFLYFSVHLAS